MKNAFQLSLIWILMVGTGCDSEESSLDWNSVKQRIRSEFPEVDQLSTQELVRMLDQGEPPLLVDGRSREEFEVSHLPGAYWAPDVESVRKVLKARSPDRPVVVYCSVGYRSSKLVEELKRAGVENVYNLEGSIFKWANEDRPLVKDDERVEKVHPFNEYWGELLQPELRSTE